MMNVIIVVGASRAKKQKVGRCMSKKKTQILTMSKTNIIHLLHVVHFVAALRPLIQFFFAVAATGGCIFPNNTANPKSTLRNSEFSHVTLVGFYPPPPLPSPHPPSRNQSNLNAVPVNVQLRKTCSTICISS